MIGGGRYEALKKKQLMEAKKKKAQESNNQKQSELKSIFEDFQQSVTNFAKSHPKEVRKNAEFREKFNQLCLDLGVDPMVSKKGLMSDLGFGDFYNELAIKIYRICISKKHINGGMMKVTELIDLHSKRSGDRITRDDIKKALDTLKDLGTGCYLKGDYVVSVPVEMNNDALNLIDIADQYGYVTVPLMIAKFSWNEDRFDRAMKELISEGLVWVDDQTNGPPHYYFSSMWKN